VLNVTLLNRVTYRQNVDKKMDHLKFRVDLVQDLLVKCSKEHKVTRPHADDNTVARLTEGHYSRRIPPTERKPEPTKWCVVYNKHGKRQRIIVHIVKWPVFTFSFLYISGFPASRVFCLSPAYLLVFAGLFL
jgi:hypothetical protein